MPPETPPEYSPQQQLDSWIGDLPYRLGILEKVLLPGHFRFDHSPGSLDALEQHLLDQDTAAGEWAELAECATAYLGEVLRAVAGGGWAWHTRPGGADPGRPVLRPDQELGLSPVAPGLLIDHALRVRTGTAFAGEAGRLRAEVAERQEAFPGWEPAAEHTPGVDPEPPLPEHPVLTEWLAGRREAFEPWSQEAFGRSVHWNQHAGTLDWLEHAVRQRFAGPAEFDAARAEPFVQGACWYLGETIRRNTGAVWQYVPVDPGAGPGAPGSPGHPWTGVPFVAQPDKRLGGAAVPLECLRDLFRYEDDVLRHVLLRFRSCSYAYVGGLLRRIGMVPAARVEAALAERADHAHEELAAHEVPGMLEAFGVAVRVHADDVDFLEESYDHLLQEAAALTGGAVTVTGVRLREDGDGDEALEFLRNGVPVSVPTEHHSDEYLDHLAVDLLMGHLDPDPAVDTRRFRLVLFVHGEHSSHDTYYVHASPEHAAVLEKELGLELR
ncbi:hypothetical protein ACIA8O_19100 [Kitasatospora sp. NPDC051853]|uniref:hypothetical protein n=1 Tax=Kitasatospora sp. NPDC051853 TaxID=3364058 RepID=UPI0037B37F42